MGTRAGGPRASLDAALGILLVLPATLLVFGLILYPFAYELGLSLTDAQAAAEGTFVGLGNYGALVRSEEFWPAVGATLLYVAATTALKLGLGMAMALALARAPSGGARSCSSCCCCRGSSRPPSRRPRSTGC